MPDLRDGESTEMKGSGAKPYVLKNVGGVYSCSCPAWRNQSDPIERRTCKHLKKLRGTQLEAERCGAPAPADDGKEKPAKEVPALLLAQPWDRVLDPTGWWFSEKLDGVRAYWDGQMLISRLGNKIHAPNWFLRELPKDGPLDGELWIKRGYFHETNGMVRRQDQNWDIWKQIHFLVFDAPRCNAVFELRLGAASRAIKNSDVARLVHHERLRDLEHLKTELKRVEAMGGEGLMLRQPGSFYEAGRSQTLLKVKNFVDDEARILGYNKGSGKFKGMVGSYQCELRSGVAFDVGTGMSNDQRKDPLPIGSIITVHYKELTKDGVPREPTFHGLRIDAKPWGKKKE